MKEYNCGFMTVAIRIFFFFKFLILKQLTAVTSPHTTTALLPTHKTNPHDALL